MRYASKKQQLAVEKLIKRLEDEGSQPTVLNLGKPFEELSGEQQDFLFELCVEQASEFQPSYVYDAESKTIQKI